MIRLNQCHEGIGNGQLTTRPNGESPAAPLHRLRAVRHQEGMSLRSVARGLGITVSEARQQECETSDLPLSILRQWAEVLGVPLVELLEEPNDSLSLPLLRRARLLRLMKTALTIQERRSDVRIKRLAQQMTDQLIEIMPELREVTPWHELGRRRSIGDYGAAFTRCISARVFGDVEEDVP